MEPQYDTESLPMYRSKVWKSFIKVFKRSLFCSPRLHLFDHKYSKKKTYNNVKYLFSMWISVKMKFISVMRNCIFSIITPVFSVTWSSEIILIFWFTAQETFLLFYCIFNQINAALVSRRDHLEKVADYV